MTTAVDNAKDYWKEHNLQCLRDSEARRARKEQLEKAAADLERNFKLAVIGSNRSEDKPKKHAVPAGILGGHSLLDLQSLNLPSRESLLGNEDGHLFFKQSINQIVAHRGVGKTMLGLSIAGALANGTSVLNFQAARPLRVMYLDGELPLSQLRQRAGLLTAGPHSAKNLFLVNPELNKPVQSIRLLDDSTWSQLLQMLDRHQSEAVILDSYSTLFWMDANKEEQQLGAQMRLNELRSRGLCVIAMQHTGKDKKTQRGHSRNEDALDTQILLTRPESAIAGKIAFDVSYPKVRHDGTFEDSGTWTLENGLWVMGESADEIGIQEYLKEGKSFRYIKDQLGVGQDKIAKTRARMVAEGLLGLNARIGKKPN